MDCPSTEDVTNECSGLADTWYNKQIEIYLYIIWSWKILFGKGVKHIEVDLLMAHGDGLAGHVPPPACRAGNKV